MFIEVGISYMADIDLAMEILKREVMAHPNWIDNRTEEDKQNGIPPVQVRVLNLGQYSVDLRAYAWALDPGRGWDLKTDLLKKVKEEFDKSGVEIPFPYQNIIMKQVES